jgi:N-dimethylarginine dimethylaminohydrolase
MTTPKTTPSGQKPGYAAKLLRKSSGKRGSSSLGSGQAKGADLGGIEAIAATPAEAAEIAKSNGNLAAPSRSPWTNPTQLDQPAFLTNFPFSLGTQVANNPWMLEMKDADREPDHVRAAVQFLSLYQHMSAEGLVCVLPTPRGCRLQDLVYTANLGIVLDHVPGRRTSVISNFTSEPRRGEAAIGARFLKEMGYDVHLAPARFEGEADLKHLHDNVYIGGYGIRSQKETYDWMEETFDMRIVKVRMVDEYYYHLDCSIFPITKENALVCTELYTKSELKQIAKHVNITPVSADDACTGICNSVRLPSQVLNASNIHDLKAGTEDYRAEVVKNRRLEDIASDLSLDVCYFNLGEYLKSGALLSCMVMHLNRASYRIALTA